MSDPARAILLLGNYRPALTLARNLNSKGWHVIVGRQGCDGGCEFSRAVAEMWDHPDPSRGKAAFFKALKQFVLERPVIKSVFPVAEEYVRLFCEHPDEMDCLPSVVTVAPETVNTCLDKMAMLKLADESQVPTAAYAEAKSGPELYGVLERIGYPSILRSLVSTVRLDGKKAVTVGNAEDVAKLEINWADLPSGVVAQQKFSGRRHNFYFAAYQGQLIRQLHAVILRTDRPDGSGLAVEGITVDPDPGLRRQTEALLKGLSYSGIGCAQYLVDEETGATSFLEINPRIAGNHAVPDFAGLDLEGFLMDVSAGKVPDLTPVTGRSAIRYAWTNADLTAAKAGYLRGETSALGALRHAATAVWAGIRADVHMVFTWKDMKPGLRALWSVVPRINRWRRPAEQAGAPANSQGSYS